MYHHMCRAHWLFTQRLNSKNEDSSRDSNSQNKYPKFVNTTIRNIFSICENQRCESSSAKKQATRPTRGDAWVFRSTRGPTVNHKLHCVLELLSSCVYSDHHRIFELQLCHKLHFSNFKKNFFLIQFYFILKKCATFFKLRLKLYFRGEKKEVVC